MGNDVNTKLQQYAIRLNKEQSDAFVAPDTQLARELYFAKHPTQLLALKCMDGRLNLSLISGTPPGIIKPYRNIGGRFDLGWPYFGELIHEDVSAAVSRGQDTIVFVTYHFSAGDTHRGCAGFGYDTEGAKKMVEHLHAQFEEIYGTQHRVVYPIMVGIETDQDALVFHGSDGAELSVAEMTEATEAELEARLRQLYPDMPDGMRRNLLPIVVGNQHHILSVREAGREPIALEHRENIIGVGRGFYWLHEPNKALIIGPYEQWVNAVLTAGKIVKGNMDAGRIDPADGVLLLVSTLARSKKGSSGWRTAEQKARFLERTAREALATAYPEFDLSVLMGVVDEQTLLLHRL
jgi:hypothetical protein